MAEVTASLPALGDDDTGTVTVTEIFCRPGDCLREADDLIEVVTDKAAFTVPCPRAGTVKQVLVSAHDELRAGAPICLLEV